jgi:hypothetical protein
MSVTMDGFIEAADGSIAINALKPNGPRLPDNAR